MALDRDVIKEQVRDKSDLVDIVSMRVTLKSSNGIDYVGLCPFHNEKSGSFHVNRQKQLYHCFGCGASGDVFDFIRDYENMTFKEALEELAQRAGIELNDKPYSKEEKLAQSRTEKLLEIQKEAARYYWKLLRSDRGKYAREYFEKRKLSDEYRDKFGLGYADKYYDEIYKYLHSKGYSDKELQESGLVSFDEKRSVMHDKFFNRVMFPIYNERDRVVAFGGRVMGDGEPKYLNSPETEIFHKSRVLYGLNFARKSKRGYLILCEGYMDVISLHQAGFDCAVAALGTAFNDRHSNLIKRYASKVYLSFDSDGAGIKAALRAIPVLKAVGISTKVIDMKPYKDPDEFIKNLGVEEYQKRIDNAVDSFLFELDVIKNEHDMSDPESLTQFQKKIAEKLMDFPVEIERENYLAAASRRFAINQDQLRGLVRTLAASGYVKKETVEKKQSVKKTENESADLKSQGLLLTWLADTPEIYPIVKSRIVPEDFTDEVYRQVAKELFTQLECGNINPAGIISMYEDDSEKRNKASAVFFRSLPFEQTVDQRKKALEDVIDNILKASQKAKLTSNVNDEDDGVSALQNYLNEQARFKKGDHK